MRLRSDAFCIQNYSEAENFRFPTPRVEIISELEIAVIELIDKT